VVWIERRAWTDLTRRRRRIVLACRLLQVACLVLAIGGLRWERERDEVCVLFAIDASRSVPDEARAAALEKVRAATDVMRADDQAGIIVFGRQPLIESAPQAGLRPEALRSQPDPDYTDIASLVRLAAGVFPEGLRRRLVIFSDGNENRGNTLEALREARAAGITIDVFPLEAPVRNEVSLARLDIPGRVEREQPFEVRIEAFSTAEGPATLRLYRDGSPLGSQRVELLEGRNLYTLSLSEERTGFHTYEAVIESPMDMRPDNNVAAGFTRVSGPQRALLIGEAADNAALMNAFGLSQLDVEAARSAPVTLAGMQDYDAIFINNLMAAEFSPAQIDALERYVKELGGGLGMIGGENAFGPGGWIGTAVETALPVRMEIKTKERFPSLALVMAIDKSGSMGGGVTSKMDMANRAAIEAVQLLGPRDLVGVVAFDSAGKWVVPLAPAERREQITRAIGSIRAGGGTDAYQAARMGYEALVSAEANLKHIILLSDGMTAPGDFEGLLVKLAEAGITLSTVAIGTDADQGFLESLAHGAGGRYYYCPDPSRVPRIFVRETILVQRSYLIEESVTPERTAAHPIMEDESIREFPALHGWVVTELEDRAEAVLKLKEDPLLAAWNYGLGKSVAFTSDARPRWARDWVASPGFVSFWDRAVRWTLRGESSADLHPRVELDGGRGRLIVDAAAGVGGERLNFLQLRANIVRPDMTTEEVTLRQTALGTYEADFPADAPGAYLAGIFDDQGRQAAAGGMVAFSPEFKDWGANEYLLHEMARQTAGTVRPKIDEIFRREGAAVRSSKEVTFGLLVAALLLLILEVALRRLVFDQERVQRLLQVLERWIPAVRSPLPAGGPADAGVASGLKERSRVVRTRLRRGRGAGPIPDGGDAAGETEIADDAGETVAAGESAVPAEPPAEAPDTLAALRSRRRRSEAADASRPGGISMESTPAPSPSPPSRPPDAAPIPSESEGGATTSRLLDAKRRRRGEDSK
jgi:Ca-activated chloride channel homolog